MSTKQETTEREFQRTHPWLTFLLDLTAAGHKLWMNLGAIQSKCEHVAHALLPPNIAGELYNLYLAKGVHATTAIEGNTLSERQVLQRIKTKEPLPPSQEYQGTEIDNIVEACNTVADRVLAGEVCDLTVEGIQEFNRLILRGLPLEEDVVPGQISQHKVAVAGYRGAPRQDCEYLLERMCEWINNIKPAKDDERIAFAVLRAVMAHLYLAWIHPFGDGNGRTARLIEFQILLGAGVPAIAAHLLSNHYNMTRTEYYRQLAATSKSGGNVLPFLEYATVGMFDGLDAQIRGIREHHRMVAWRDYVYEVFQNRDTAAARRQRDVALALGTRRKLFPLAKVRLLTPAIAAAYAGKTAKTVNRDINVLHKLKLLAFSSDRSKVRARSETLQKLLPRRREAGKRR